jgi:SAM-dependent methyltransferase
MWNLVSTRVTQFGYFNEILDRPDWKASKILDFGGNVGSFLTSADGAVNHDDYWCLDLNRSVLEIGRREFPDAHFVHYNRYSSQYNPDGVRNLAVPDLGLKFDVIMAFSVFTHTHPSEMIELVGQLRELLAPAGALAFTFTDPSYDRTLSDPSLPAGTDVRKMLQWQQAENPSLEIEWMVEAAFGSKWCLLIDDKLYIEPGIEFSHQERRGRPNESYCSYFTVDYIASLFPEAKVFPPVSPEWQHCCVIRNE